MVEELKVIADMLKGVSESAINGVIAYLVFMYVKPVTIWVIASFTTIKVVAMFRPQRLEVGDVEVIRIDES